MKAVWMCECVDVWWWMGMKSLVHDPRGHCVGMGQVDR